MNNQINLGTAVPVDPKIEMVNRFNKAIEESSYVNFKKICYDYQRDYYTNLIHSYPAKMYGPIAQSLIYIYAKKGNTILDPFCGTGTVLMQAKLYGMNSIGIDINPLACLIAKAKTSSLNIHKLREEANRLFSSIRKNNLDIEIPSFENIDYWFEKKKQEDLARILYEVKKVSNRKYKNFFQVCLSSIIRKASNADPEIKPPVKTKKMFKLIESGRKVDIIEEFENIVNINLKRLEKFCLDCDKSASVKIISDDFKNVDIPDETIDLVITSPPYIGSQKYIRSTRLELLWLSLVNSNKLRELDRNTIGTERILSKEININKLGIRQADKLIKNIKKIDIERAYMVYKYFFNMEECIHKIYRILKKRKYLILVIGDNTVRGYNIPTHRILSEIMKRKGFKKDKILRDKIKYRGFMKKRNCTAGIIDYEWVLIFQK